MDFMERLCVVVNAIPKLPVKCKLGFLENESLSLYPLPGSKVLQTYYSGESVQALNYEFAMKSKSQSKINQTLWVVSNALEQITEIDSIDNSFEFDELIITNKPFINEADDQGFFTFLLDVQAKITVLNKEELING